MNQINKWIIYHIKLFTLLENKMPTVLYDIFIKDKYKENNFYVYLDENHIYHNEGQKINKKDFINIFNKINHIHLIDIAIGEKFINNYINYNPHYLSNINTSTFDKINNYSKYINFNGIISLSTLSPKSNSLLVENIISDDAHLDDCFAIHSVGKIFTGLLLIILIDRKILNENVINETIKLDNDVLNVLPSDVKNHLKNIKLCDVMVHKSGLHDYLGNYYDDIDNAVRSHKQIPNPFQPEDFLKYADDIISSNNRLDNNYVYSNLGILLLGLSIKFLYNNSTSNIKILSYNEILNKYIIEPFNLTSFSINRPTNSKYNSDDKIGLHINGSPAGGYWINADNLRKFGENVNRLYNNSENIQRLFNLYGSEFYDKGGQSHYILHAGAIDSSSAYFVTSPKDNLSLVILSNMNHQAIYIHNMIKILISCETSNEINKLRFLPNLKLLRDHGTDGGNSKNLSDFVDSQHPNSSTMNFDSSFNKFIIQLNKDYEDPICVKFFNQYFNMKLYYVGVSHTSQSDSDTFKLIKYVIEKVDKIKLVILEGIEFSFGLSPDLDNVFGETKYSIDLAKKYNIQYHGLETNEDIIFNKLKNKYKTIDLYGYYFMRQYKYLYKTLHIEQYEDIVKDFNENIDYIKRLLGECKFDPILWFKERFNKEFIIGHNLEFGAPYKNTNIITQEISYKYSRIRDRLNMNNLFKIINKYNEFDKILIIMGKNHLYADFEVLLDLFKNYKIIN